MPRATPRAGRSVDEVGEAIVAAWFKSVSFNPPKPIDANEMTATFNDILEQNCVAVIDTADTINIAVPYPPKTTVAELVDYLHTYTRTYDTPNAAGYSKDNPTDPNKHRKKKYSEDLGLVVIFGCGR